MPSRLSVQPHVVQQLFLAGDISGATQAGNAEADQRVKHLQDKLEHRPIDWLSVISQFDGPAIKFRDGPLNSDSMAFGDTLFNVSYGPHLREHERRQV